MNKMSDCSVWVSIVWSYIQLWLNSMCWSISRFGLGSDNGELYQRDSYKNAGLDNTDFCDTEMTHTFVSLAALRLI